MIAQQEYELGGHSTSRSYLHDGKERSADVALLENAHAAVELAEELGITPFATLHPPALYYCV